MKGNADDTTRREEGQTAFFFIPDMSGFTRFMNNTNLEDSAALTHDLLEVLIDSNISGLDIAEIQGDAIFFYKLGDPLPLKMLEKQARKTFLDFQEALSALERKHELLQGARNLTLKILVHFGKVQTTSVKGTLKLVGADVVIATRIMKNNIPGKEYLLMTEQYLKTQPAPDKKCFAWGEMKTGRIFYEHLGNINYRYIDLHPLREEINI